MPQRVRYVWINGLKQTRRRKTKVPHQLTLSKGSTHIAARREFVDFALNDPRAQDFLGWLRNTRVPDETFFNSLNRSPQLNIPGSYNGTLRYVRSVPTNSVSLHTAREIFIYLLLTYLRKL